MREVRGVPQDFSQPHYRIVNPMIEVDEGIAMPESIPQFLPSDNLPGFLEKHGENLKGLLGKLDAKTVLAKFGGVEIHLEDAKPNDPCRSGGRSHFAHKPGGV